MKLRSCHIDNFGKLSDLHLEFQDGVNLFHEPNAWGKSTLAAFLRVMFYGFDSKRESGLFDKERVVFRPWQGGTYGGELDFSYQGKEYRISRTFGKTEKTDVFHLYDLSTNLECHDFSSEIGSEIFGLDSASFKRSAFIAQNDCECCSTDAINAKLGNLVENTNDINNFETAQKKIHDRMNKLSPDRATGSMKKRTNMITLLTEELRGYDAAEASYKKITEKLTEKQEQRKELAGIRDQYAKALQVASEESRREGIKQAYAAILQEEQEKKEMELLAKHKVNFIVLARYMQVISEKMINAYPNRIINIHHSFLPAFVGAKPYHAAFERGVKIIGATSHYVTTELDAGPIIEQDVVRITHKDTVQDLVNKGKDLEKIVLSRAVQKHIERKVLAYKNKTVIFN